MNPGSRVIHIRLQKDGDWPPFESEEVSAVQVGDHQFRLESPPAFARRLAVGDVVRVVHHGSAHDMWIEEVLEWSGHSTVRVIVFRDAGTEAEDELLAGVPKLSCSIRPTGLESLFAIDVPDAVEYSPLQHFLEDGSRRGLWDYEEAAISRVHDQESSRLD